MVGHIALQACQRVTQSLHLPYMVGRGLLFQVWFHPDDTVDSESAMGIKPGDSGMVIGYQVVEFTHTWSADAVFGSFPTFILGSLVRCHH